MIWLQAHPTEFYAIKGTLALIATVMLIVHMTLTWGAVQTLGRQMRYYTLLAFSVLITGASAEQIHENAEVSYRNVAAVVCVLLLIVTMAVSIREDAHR